MNTAIPKIAIMIVACLLSASCQSNMNEVWTGSFGRVPTSTPTPDGFIISPHDALVIAEKEYGMKKAVQHVYADSTYYYIVDGFFGSNRYKAYKTGVRVDGKSGAHKRFDPS